ncbi:MAG: Ig-like domain repeat protein [Nitrososphaerales archaeon]
MQKRAKHVPIIYCIAGWDFNGDGASAAVYYNTPALPTASTTTVSCSPSPVAAGSITTCTATVSGSSPTGPVSFSTPGFSPSSCILVSSSCSVSYTTTSVGSYTVTANYAGDSSNSGSSGMFTLVVNKDVTTTSLSCLSAYIQVRQGTTCTVALIGGISPTGTIEFLASPDDIISLSSASCTLSSGTCSVNVIGINTGSVTLTAYYTGDLNNLASSGQTTLSVTKAMKDRTTTQINPSSGSTTSGASMTLTITVNDLGSSPTVPTGVISLKGHGTFSSSTCTLEPFNSSASQCSVTYTVPTHGHAVNIIAKYLGDSHHFRSHGLAKFTITKIKSTPRDSEDLFLLSQKPQF